MPPSGILLLDVDYWLSRHVQEYHISWYAQLAPLAHTSYNGARAQHSSYYHTIRPFISWLSLLNEYRSQLNGLRRNSDVAVNCHSTFE